MNLARPSLLVLLAAVAPAAAAAQQGPVEDLEGSPVLSEFARRLDHEGPEAEDRFWSRVEEEGTPLVDTASAPPGHATVTFVYRGGPDVRSVRLASNLGALLIEGVTPDFDSLGEMRRVPGSDVWYLSFRLRNDVRAPYRFEVARADTTVTELDPRNPAVWEPDRPGLAASILELPGAPPQPWRAYSESDVGDWDRREFEEGPDAGRTVYVYKPRGWDGARPEPYPVPLGLGAFGHGIGMRVDRLVDHLIATGRLAPLVVALADLEPGSDTTRYRATTDFVADRFLPWLRDRYDVSADPGDVVLSGTSRRGMVASLVALRRPDAVGNVISLSGSYYWKPAREVEYEWIPRLYARHPRQPIRLYVAAGELETVVTPGNAGHYLVATNRRFRDVLAAAGYRFTYREFNGVHSELNWQDWLARGLVQLLGARL